MFELPCEPKPAAIIDRRPRSCAEGRRESSDTLQEAPPLRRLLEAALEGRALHRASSHLKNLTWSLFVACHLAQLDEGDHGLYQRIRNSRLRAAPLGLNAAAALLQRARQHLASKLALLECPKLQVEPLRNLFSALTAFASQACADE